MKWHLSISRSAPQRGCAISRRLPDWRTGTPTVACTRRSRNISRTISARTRVGTRTSFRGTRTVCSPSHSSDIHLRGKWAHSIHKSRKKQKSISTFPLSFLNVPSLLRGGQTTLMDAKNLFVDREAHIFFSRRGKFASITSSFMQILFAESYSRT